MMKYVAKRSPSNKQSDGVKRMSIPSRIDNLAFSQRVTNIKCEQISLIARKKVKR